MEICGEPVREAGVRKSPPKPESASGCPVPRAAGSERALGESGGNRVVGTIWVPPVDDDPRSCARERSIESPAAGGPNPPAPSFPSSSSGHMDRSCAEPVGVGGVRVAIWAYGAVRNCSAKPWGSTPCTGPRASRSMAIRHPTNCHPFTSMGWRPSGRANVGHFQCSLTTGPVVVGTIRSDRVVIKDFATDDYLPLSCPREVLAPGLPIRSNTAC